MPLILRSMSHFHSHEVPWLGSRYLNYKGVNLTAYLAFNVGHDSLPRNLQEHNSRTFLLDVFQIFTLTGKASANGVQMLKCVFQRNAINNCSSVSGFLKLKCKGKSGNNRHNFVYTMRHFHLKCT